MFGMNEAANEKEHSLYEMKQMSYTLQTMIFFYYEL